MTVTPDPYNFVNGATADADQVDARFLPLYTALNGALDVDNLLPAVKQKLGLSDAGVVRRGFVNTPASESTASTSYALLGTPDRVSSVVLPANGLIAVVYLAAWQSTDPSNCKAGVFLGANQVRREAGVQEVVGGAGLTPTTFKALGTTSGGLVAAGGTGVAPVSTGSVVVPGTSVADTDGGVMLLEAAAGTYDVSVRFLTASGTVTVKNRRLWVWTMAF